MGDVLEVALVLAGVEIDRNQRVGVEVVTGADRTVEVRRGIADHEIDELALEIDRRILPYAAAEGLVGDAQFLERLFLCRDVAMHGLASGVVGGPQTN